MRQISTLVIRIQTMLNKFFKSVNTQFALGSLLRNAYRGWPNSQLELAEVYLFEVGDIIEAYAWADVACIRRLEGARDIKALAEAKLTSEEMVKAVDLARQYKLNFIPS